jgi:hypothetical protein
MSDVPEVMGPTCLIYVCGECGMPTETEPCAEHQPEAYAAMFAEPVTFPRLAPLRVSPEAVARIREALDSLGRAAADLGPLVARALGLRPRPTPAPPSHTAENTKFGARQRHRRRRR